MLPNLSELKLARTSSSRLKPLYDGNDVFEQLADRQWMASELRKSDEYLVLPMTMNTLTCVVRYGKGPGKHLPVPLAHVSTVHTQMDFPINGLVQTVMTFEYKEEEGNGRLPLLTGAIGRFYFPELGLLPEWHGWGPSRGCYFEMEPHKHLHFISRPGDEDYNSDDDDEWAKLKGDEWDQTKARGADCYTFALDPREFTEDPNTIKGRTFERIKNVEERFEKDSILFADYFWSLDGGAQVVLDKASREKRYAINEDEGSESWSAEDNLDLPGRLKYLYVEICFRHPPFGAHLPHLAKKRARDPEV